MLATVTAMGMAMTSLQFWKRAEENKGKRGAIFKVPEKLRSVYSMFPADDNNKTVALSTTLVSTITDEFTEANNDLIDMGRRLRAFWVF
ncbi:hypothetical protein TIFTF001_016808 [Ficus carica]|uniref:Uncharacterized protein n=1 Tax=Ficus carica TaxID=3494 RepID=A0AA88AK57_FICCA|nr:hypothetical protein TIFTF001_016808 [Ficus carica]